MCISCCSLPRCKWMAAALSHIVLMQPQNAGTYTARRFLLEAPSISFVLVSILMNPTTDWVQSNRRDRRRFNT